MSARRRHSTSGALASLGMERAGAAVGRTGGQVRRRARGRSGASSGEAHPEGHQRRLLADRRRLVADLHRRRPLNAGVADKARRPARDRVTTSGSLLAGPVAAARRRTACASSCKLMEFAGWSSETGHTTGMLSSHGAHASAPCARPAAVQRSQARQRGGSAPPPRPSRRRRASLRASRIRFTTLEGPHSPGTIVHTSCSTM